MHRPSNFNNNRGGPPQGRPTNRAAGAPQRRGPPVPQVAGGGQRGRFGASKVGRNSGFNCSLEEFRVKLKESLARDPPTLNDVHVTARYGDERDHQPNSRAVDFNASGAQKTSAFCESTVAPPPAMPPTIDEEEEEPLEAAVEAFAPADPFREHLWAAHQAGAGNTLALRTPTTNSMAARFNAREQNAVVAPEPARVPAAMDPLYPASNRGILKILQIVVGFIICSLLCANWYGGRSCLGEGRLGYASGLNFVVVVVNIVLYGLDCREVHVKRFEYWTSMVCAVMWAIVGWILGCLVYEEHFAHARFVGGTALLLVEFVLFLFDVKILQGEMMN